MKSRYVIVRVGTPDNFKWVKSAPYTPQVAQHVFDTMADVGYYCTIESVELIDAIGLPTGFWGWAV